MVWPGFAISEDIIFTLERNALGWLWCFNMGEPYCFGVVLAKSIMQYGFSGIDWGIVLRVMLFA
jgi:hypothetical protein